MKLQLIASEVHQIPEQLEELKGTFVKTEIVKVVNSENDIDTLRKLLSTELNSVHSKTFEKIGLGSIETQFRLAKPHYDPNSVSDNFI